MPKKKKRTDDEGGYLTLGSRRLQISSRLRTVFMSANTGREKNKWAVI